MKLRGTRTESDYRKKLIRSRRSLYEDEDKRRILIALSDNYPSMKTAYTLAWIPEQGEDIYKILIDSEIVATVEVDRFDLSRMPNIEDVSVAQYQKKLSKHGRVKLSVALDLVRVESIRRGDSAGGDC